MDERRSRRRAVALTAEDGEQAARVVARGYGELAEQVIGDAHAHGIPVHEAPELVALLMGLDLDERIPDILYDLIAELLVWLRQQDEDQGDGE